MAAEKTVANYYEKNTGLFLRFGSSGGGHALHRGLWGPGVADATTAARYVNTLIAEKVLALGYNEPMAILDLGSGVGGTIFHLAELFPGSRFHGVTISPRQVDFANALGQDKGLTERCAFTLGDFETITIDFKADIIIALESFIHSAAPSSFFATVHRHLAPTGHLIIVDDFLSEAPSQLSNNARKHLRTFKQGWQVPGLCTMAEFETAAAEAGLAVGDSDDLTPLIRLTRPRDRLVSLCAPLIRHLGLMRVSFLANIAGGNALNISLKNGVLRYTLVVLHRR